MSDSAAEVRRAFHMLQQDSAAEASEHRSLIRKQADRIEALETILGAIAELAEMQDHQTLFTRTVARHARALLTGGDKS